MTAVRFLFIFLIFICAFGAKGNSTDFMQLVKPFEDLPTDDFLESFPFNDFIKTCPLDDVAQLEKYKNYLFSLGIDGDVFLYTLFEKYMEKSEINFDQLESVRRYFYLGELMAHSRMFLPDSIRVYFTISDIIYSHISADLEAYLKENVVGTKDFEIFYVVERLKENKYLVEVRPSNLAKFFKYIREKKWDYIGHKLTTSYLQEFVISLVVLFLITPGFLWLAVTLIRSRRRKKTR